MKEQVDRPVGRNDPCPCGSGKKFKQCCLNKQEEKKVSSLLGRKFTAKVIKAGHELGVPTPLSSESPGSKVVVDYAVLMERAYGPALHSYLESPPLPTSENQYREDHR